MIWHDICVLFDFHPIECFMFPDRVKLSADLIRFENFISHG